ncbi:Uncharacterised protein [Anaerobiospirillum thomasii]|uniref:hypothetical protein n=1 Tax=Anaerobiospirillum thomasii TaxID=179995 RepID=UPI000D8E5040|nr:hypothetical protein [Anaerobiospirillum thomasii]SPT67959.1 Uncharacterised protein [Anaerobiospirillum thomasii]
MHNKVIGVSVFGINDGIYIDDVDIGIKDYIPSVVIEDFDNKVYMYSNSAKFDKTGLSLDRESYNQKSNSRKMIALLWQQLELSDEKSYQANLLCRYILETIKESINSNPDIKDKISIHDLKKNYTIVLCIPDTCGVSEQDALLRAFNGYDLKLVWRSVASLLAYYEDESINQSQTGSDSISVLYVGPDSIDVIEYGVEEVEHNSKLYSVPKRHQAVYESNQIPINGTDLTIALVNDIINSQYPYMEKSVKDKFARQIFYRFSFVWGKEQRANSINTLFCYTDDQYEYKTVSLESKSDFSDIKYTDLIDDIYKDNDIKDVGYKSQNNSYIYELIRDEIARRCSSETVLCTGPLIESEIISRYIIDYVSNRNFSKTFRTCTNMAYGAVVFNKRQENREPTYKEKIDKVSYIATNEREERYEAVVLINEQYIEPTDICSSEHIPFILKKGNLEINLYISNDNKFNQEALDKAKEESFKEQNIKVLKATPKKFKKEVDDDINVEVYLEQKLLSGYIKVIIKSLDEKDNDFIPKSGISVAFDREHQELYEGTFKYKKLRYSDYHVLDLTCSSKITLSYSSKSNYLNRFVSSSKSSNNSYYKCYYNKYSKVEQSLIDKIDEYNNEQKIESKGFKDQIKNLILIDRGRTSETLKQEIYSYLQQSSVTNNDYFYMLDALTKAMSKDDLEQVMLLLTEYQAREENKYSVLKVCRYLVMRNPMLFNPDSKYFNFPERLKDIMYSTAINFLQETLNKKELELKIDKKKNSIRIVGQQKVNMSFSIFIYVLWYRKNINGRSFLTNESDINNIDILLSAVIDCYNNDYNKVLKDTDLTLDEKSLIRYNDFIISLRDIKENLISLLQAKGSDKDILAISEQLLETESRQ